MWTCQILSAVMACALLYGTGVKDGQQGDKSNTTASFLIGIGFLVFAMWRF